MNIFDVRGLAVWIGLELIFMSMMMGFGTRHQSRIMRQQFNFRTNMMRLTKINRTIIIINIFTLVLVTFFVIMSTTLAEETTNGWIYLGYPREMKDGEESTFVIFITASGYPCSSSRCDEFKNIEWDKPHQIKIGKNMTLMAFGDAELFKFEPGDTFERELTEYRLDDYWAVKALNFGKGKLNLHYISEGHPGVNIPTDKDISIKFDMFNFFKHNWQILLQAGVLGSIFGVILTLLRRGIKMTQKDKEKMDGEK